MKMIIADFLFDGPHKSVKKIENSPGVFTVISELGDAYYLLDVDHSDDLKKAIQEHERRESWETYRRGLLRYAVYYTREAEDRENVEKKIRGKYKNIPCGRGNP